MGNCTKINKNKKDKIVKSYDDSWMKNGLIDKFVYLEKLNSKKSHEIQELVASSCYDLNDEFEILDQHPSYNNFFVNKHKDKLKRGFPNYAIKNFLLYIFNINLRRQSVKSSSSSPRESLYQSSADKPYFGRKDLLSHTLSTKGLFALHRILKQIEKKYTELVFCPLLPRIIQFLLWFVSEDLAAIISAIIVEESLLESSKKKFIYDSPTKLKLLVKKSLKVIKFPVDKKKGSGILKNIINDMFVDIVPIEYLPLVFVAYLVNGVEFLAVLAGTLYSYICNMQTANIHDLKDICNLLNIPEIIYQCQSPNPLDLEYSNRISSISFGTVIFQNFTFKFSRPSKIFITDEHKSLLFNIIPKSFIFGSIFNEFCNEYDGLLIEDLNCAWHKMSLGSVLVIKHFLGVCGIFFDRHLDLIENSVDSSQCFLFNTVGHDLKIYKHQESEMLQYSFLDKVGIVIGNPRENVLNISYSLLEVFSNSSEIFNSPVLLEEKYCQIYCLELYLFK